MRPCATTLEPEMSSAELALLKETLRSLALSGKHLEIGTAAGGTLVHIMKCYSDSESPQFVVIDPMKYFPDQQDTVRQNLSSHGINPDLVDFRVVTSNEGWQLAKQAHESFSFILVDGAHKIRYVMEDLRWGSLIEKGGVLCFHDYCDKFPDVTKAVNRFLRKNQNYKILNHVEKLIVLQKTADTLSSEVTIMDRYYSFIWSPILQLQRSVRKRLAP